MIAEVIDSACETRMNDSANISTCMWVRQFADWVNVCVKQFHACDSSEIATKNETELGQASIHVNDSKHSNRSSKQYFHKQKHKKQQK